MDRGAPKVEGPYLELTEYRYTHDIYGEVPELGTPLIRPDEITFPANIRTRENDRSLELK